MKVIDRAFGSVLLDINDNELTVRYVQSTGAITNTMTIIKVSRVVGVIEPHDVDGDSKGDLISRNTSNGSTAIWLMNGAAMASTGFPGGVPLVWQIAGIGDVNADGKADIIWRNTNNGSVAVWVMNGITVMFVGFPGSASMDWAIQKIGDVDGNGKCDLVWQNTSCGVVALWLMNGATNACTAFLAGVSSA